MTSMADVIDNQQQIISIVDEINENAMPQDVKTKIQKRVQQVEEDLEEIQSGNSIVLTCQWNRNLRQHSEGILPQGV